MGKLQVYVCENFYPEYKTVVEANDFSDVELCIFPSMCDSKKKKEEAQEVLSDSKYKNCLLVCSRSCDAIKLIPEESEIETITTNYCFGHLISDSFLDYLTTQGNYI